MHILYIYIYIYTHIYIYIYILEFYASTDLDVAKLLFYFLFFYSLPSGTHNFIEEPKFIEL